MGEPTWRCPRCGATSRAETDRMCVSSLHDIWCPGFVAVELTEYPDGRTCAGYLPGFAPDSRAMYAALLKAHHGGTKDAG